MNVASYVADKTCGWRFLGGEDGADCDLGYWPAERVCDLTCR